MSEHISKWLLKSMSQNTTDDYPDRDRFLFTDHLIPIKQLTPFHRLKLCYTSIIIVQRQIATQARLVSDFFSDLHVRIKRMNMQWESKVNLQTRSTVQMCKRLVQLKFLAALFAYTPLY